MKRLLDYVENEISVHFYVGEVIWPTLEQVDAAVAELSAQPRASSLVLRLVQQLEMDKSSSFDYTQFDSVLQRLCDRLRERAPHVSSITLEVLAAGMAAAPSPAAQIAALASMPSLKHLAVTGWSMQPDHFGDFSVLTRLTSLELSSQRDVDSPRRGCWQAVLQPLSSLQSLKLSFSSRKFHTMSRQVQLQLPAALQRLAHLSLKLSTQHHTLLLTAEPCQRLESLTAELIQLPAGVTALSKLQQLELQAAPATPVALPQLTAAKLNSAVGLQQMLQGAGVLQHLDLSGANDIGRKSRYGRSQQQQQLVQELRQALADLPPLCTLLLPKALCVTEWTPAVLAQHASSLQRLQAWNCVDSMDWQQPLTMLMSLTALKGALAGVRLARDAALSATAAHSPERQHHNPLAQAVCRAASSRPPCCARASPPAAGALTRPSGAPALGHAALGQADRPDSSARPVLH